MFHPTERGNYMKAINTQLLNDIEEAQIRQLRKAYLNEPSKGLRSLFYTMLSMSVLVAILLTVWI